MTRQKVDSAYVLGKSFSAGFPVSLARGMPRVSVHIAMAVRPYALSVILDSSHT